MQYWRLIVLGKKQTIKQDNIVQHAIRILLLKIVKIIDVRSTGTRCDIKINKMEILQRRLFS